MVAFADYLDLRVAVADHVGNRNISDVMPRLVQMAESYLNRRLRTNYQVTTDDVTFTEGVGPLPADFLEFINVYGNSDMPMHSSALPAFYRTCSMWGSYQINGSNITINGQNGTRRVQYYAELPSLIESGTNWLLENYPEVYLYAVGLEAAKFLKDAELIPATEQLLETALRSVRVDDERRRYSNTVVRVQGVNP